MRKILALLLFILLLPGLSACGGKTAPLPESTPGETRLSDLAQPPELRVRCGGREVTAEKTTYTWLHGGTGVEADGVHPLQMVDGEGRISLTPLPVPAGAEAELVFALMPEEVTVRRWPAEMACFLHRDPGLFSGYLERAEDLPVAEGRVAPATVGNYIYEVYAKWSDDAGTHGSAYYAFYTTVSIRPEAGEGRDPDLAFLEKLSGYGPEDWEKARRSEEYRYLFDLLLDTAVGADQAQRDIYVMTAVLHSDGVDTMLLSNILPYQREADPEAWSEALSAFSPEEGDLLRSMTDFAEEERAGTVVSAPFWFTEVRMEDLPSVSLRGLTEEDRVEWDSLADSDREKLLEFLRRLSPVKVPISEEEWNSVFFSGYLRMEFSLGGHRYTIRADQPDAVYVFWQDPEGETDYIGKFQLEEKYFRGAAELLYPPEPFVFTRQNFPRLNGSTSTVPLAEAVCSALLGESREDVGDLIHFSKTTQAYRELLGGKADLLIIGEANADILAEKEAKGFEWLKTPFATDAFVFVVNENNPVDSITLEQARRIYTGEITNWSELGGGDVPIIPFQRNPEAGSQTLMEKHVMQGAPMMEAPADYIIDTMGGLMEAVKSYDNSAGAIGYSVYYYAEEMKAAQGLKLLKLEGVEPNPDTIRSEEYPIVNPKYVVISAKAAEDSPTRKLYDWLLSGEGQALIAAEGYVSILDIPPEKREFSLVGKPWEGDWEGLAPLEKPEPVTLYAGVRLRDSWPGYTGCLYGLMTPEGQALTPPVYSSISRLTWYGQFTAGSRRLDAWVLRQGTGEPWPSANGYTLAASDLSWVWPGTWQKVIPGPDFFLLLGEDHMEQVSEKGERLGSWSYAAYGLETDIPYLMSDYDDGYEGIVDGNSLVVHVDYSGQTDLQLTLFHFEDGSLETVSLEELEARREEPDPPLHWTAENTEAGCRITRGEESFTLPVPAPDEYAWVWGDLVYFQTGERIFLRDGTELLPPEDFPGWRECTPLGHSLGWMEAGDLLKVSITGKTAVFTFFLRADGSMLNLRAEEPLAAEPVLSVTLDGNILGIVERDKASCYRIDTEECVFRIPLGYEAD